MSKDIEKWREFYLARNEAFLGGVESDHIDQVITDLMKLSKDNEQVTLVICSPGGSTHDGFKLAQFIELELQRKVIARVWSQCSSAATYPLLCCDTRIAHPQARFVLHRQTSGIQLEYTDNFEKQLEEWKRDNRATHDKQVAFYSRQLGKTPKEVEKILLRGMGIDRAMSAREAKELGLITKIVNSRE